MLDRDQHSSLDDTSWSDDYWFAPDTGEQRKLQASPIAIGAAYQVTTEDVIDVLGPDADELLANSKLDMGELVELLNAETMLLPRIDAEFEAEIEQALAGEADEVAPQPKRALRKHAQQSPWRKRFLRAAIGAVLLTAAGGGIAAASMNKSVTLDVDGKSTTVNTFSGTVGDVLNDEGLKAGPHDTLSPSPNASVADGGRVTLDRGRQLNLSVDGVTQQHWVHSGSLGDALRNLGIDARTAWLSKDVNSAVPLAGETVQLKTLKTITMIDGANAPRNLQTHATTVGELLKSLNINLGNGDSVSPGATTPITNNSQVMISRTGIQVVNQQQDITPPVQQVNDDSMLQGQTKVADPGTPGKQMVTYRITSVNGKESKREQLAVKVLTPAKPQIVHVGTKKPPEPAMSNEALWDKIAGCESTNNWSDNTGNGYYGGLQFDRGTWLSNGGGEYAPTADKASKAQQIDIANRVKAARGLSPWQCAGELGLD